MHRVFLRDELQDPHGLKECGRLLYHVSKEPVPDHPMIPSKALSGSSRLSVPTNTPIAVNSAQHDALMTAHGVGLVTVGKKPGSYAPAAVLRYAAVAYRTDGGDLTGEYTPFYEGAAVDQQTILIDGDGRPVVEKQRVGGYADNGSHECQTQPGRGWPLTLMSNPDRLQASRPPSSPGIRRPNG